MADLQTLTTTAAAFPARYFAAWNGRDSLAATAVLAPTFVWRDPSLPVALTTVEDAQIFFESSWRSYPDLDFELLGEPMVEASGRQVAQVWRMTGTHQGEGVPAGVPATGRSVDVVGTDVFTVDGEGRATEIRACYDALTLATQLGLMG